MVRQKTYDRREREHERERMAWERERKELLDRIMLLAGNPWTPPPAYPDPEPVDDPWLGPAETHLHGVDALG